MNDMGNRFKNVLFCILPVVKFDVQLPYSPYCGIGYIAQALKKNEIAYKFLDLRFKNLRNRLFDIISQMRPALLGVTMFSQGYKYGYGFLEKIKSVFPEVKIVVGGPHASCFKKKMLDECWAIDYGITLEGDDTIVELCQGNSLETIRGLLYRDDGQIKYTGDRPFILDLDRLGFPHYEGFDLQNYAVKSMAISTSRGCFAKCTFCTVACTHGRHVRLRSAQHVADEICYWYNKGYYMIVVTDDNFTVNRARVLELCNLLRHGNLKGLQIKLDNGVRADCVDEELLEAMFAAGINKISFGVESANEHVLENIKKGESLARIENAIRLALKTGMQVHLTFIIGLPGESEQDVRRSFEFAKRMGVHNVAFYTLIPYPESELFEWAKAGNHLLYSPEEHLNFIVEPGKETSVLLETPILTKDVIKSLYEEGQDVRRNIERVNQIKILEPKVGSSMAKVLIAAYTNKWFEKIFERSFIIKRYTFKLRNILNV